MPREEFDSQVDELETEEGGEGITHENGALNNRIKALEQNQALSAVLADPDVQKVLLAKQAGKKVQVSDLVEQEEEEQAEEEPEEITTLDDKDPLKATLRTIDNLIQKRLGKVLESVTGLSERIEGVEGVAGSVQRKEVQQQIDAAKKKYQDFDEYKAQMLELTKANPGLGVEDLYLVAKSRAGKLKLDQPSTFTEKPQGARRGTSVKPKTKQEARPKGRQGFSQMLQEALGDLDLSALE